jgi:hypothetical protein
MIKSVKKAIIALIILVSLLVAYHYVVIYHTKGALSGWNAPGR